MCSELHTIVPQMTPFPRISQHPSGSSSAFLPPENAAPISQICSVVRPTYLAMSDSPHSHKHQQQRPDRLFVPVSRLYPAPSYSAIPFSPSAPTPSKQRRRTFSSSTSLSSVFLLLFSLRSLYSLLPFLRSSTPSFSLFPFSFLVALLSFFISFILSSSSSSNDSPPLRNLTLFSSPSALRPLFAKSSLLALVFLLRYQALRSCGTAATILAEFSGTIAAKSLSERRGRIGGAAQAPFRGSAALLLSLVLLSLGWDQIGCLPFSVAVPSLDDAGGGRSCVRILPMLLPFLAGFLAFFERASANWGAKKFLNFLFTIFKSFLIHLDWSGFCWNFGFIEIRLIRKTDLVLFSVPECIRPVCTDNCF